MGASLPLVRGRGGGGGEEVRKGQPFARKGSKHANEEFVDEIWVERALNLLPNALWCFEVQHKLLGSNSLALQRNWRESMKLAWKHTNIIII
jgi:hypothetical protein